MNKKVRNLLVLCAVVLLGLVGTVSADASTSSWRAVYWNNDSLAGTPTVVRMETSLNHNWGVGSPAPDIQADYFSARWTTTVNLPAGTYKFTATSDDGMMVLVDDNQIINMWYEHPPLTIVAYVDLAAGEHKIQVDYFELTGIAVAQLDWARVDSGAPPQPPASNLTAVVQNVSVLNVRQIPGDFNSKIVGRVVRGETVNLTGCRTADAKYIQLRLADGAVGWVNQNYLKAPYSFNQLAVCGTGGSGPDQPLTGTITNVSVLNVREIPGDFNSRIVGRVVRGETVGLTGYQSADGKYVQLRLPNGAVGWVNKAYIDTTANMSSFAVAR
ncbi:MAG: PA14 domain-containing protein [Anaerolineae bacterium]|nr:PA14 domain-containing protein [Anaerolineae bacterium]